MEERNIPGYPEYYKVTKCGRVFSYYAGKRVEKTYYYEKGYKKVSLSSPIKGASKNIGVHRCIALAWLEKPEGKYHVLHKDDDRTNNAIENLYWGDHLDNQRDKKINGKSPLGDKSGTNVLTDEQVIYSRQHYKMNCRKFGVRALSRSMKVSNSTMSEAISGITWPHLPSVEELQKQALAEKGGV